MKLSELRPCDGCKGAIAPMFFVVKATQVCIDPRAVDTTMGLSRMFGGALGLAEVMTSHPDATKEIAVLPEVFLCTSCFIDQCRTTCEKWDARIEDEKKATVPA